MIIHLFTYLTRRNNNRFLLPILTSEVYVRLCVNAPLNHPALPISLVTPAMPVPGLWHSKFT
jgi:hypothetical protein